MTTTDNDDTSATSVDNLTSTSCSSSSTTLDHDESSSSSSSVSEPATATTSLRASGNDEISSASTEEEAAKKQDAIQYDGHGDDDHSSCCIEDLYKLDYEIEAIAAGGEVLRSGVHVYMECTGYQHHAIVLDTSSWDTSNTSSSNDGTATTAKDKNDAEHENFTTTTTNTPFILIAEFTNAALAAENIDFFQSTSTASGAVSTADGVEGGFRYVQETNPSQWHVVKYQANPIETLTWRPGTCSNATPSDTATILSRIQFLHDCRHLIPNYHLLASNCETVAVWCMTGKWETLQGNGFFNKTKLATLAATSIGVVAMPVGLAASGIAAWHEYTIQQSWKQTNQQLNREFSWYNMGRKKT